MFVNYFQLVGPSRCASCLFETDPYRSWAEQEKDFRDHFNANHSEKYGFKIGTTAFFTEAYVTPAPSPEPQGFNCPSCGNDIRKSLAYDHSKCIPAREWRFHYSEHGPAYFCSGECSDKECILVREVRKP
jgi:hypothetical protein